MNGNGVSFFREPHARKFARTNKVPSTIFRHSGGDEGSLDAAVMSRSGPLAEHHRLSIHRCKLADARRVKLDATRWKHSMK